MSTLVLPQAHEAEASVAEDGSQGGGFTYALGAGSSAAQEITAAVPTDGGRLALDSIEAFDPAGGWALIALHSGTPEAISFAGVDPATRELTGILRPDPQSHDDGQYIEHVLGSLLSTSVTKSSPANGGSLELDDLDGLDPDGGILVLQPGSPGEEELTYQAIDEDASTVTGIKRDDPSAHEEGSFVQAETAEMQALTEGEDPELMSGGADESEPDIEGTPEPMIAPGGGWTTHFNGSDNGGFLRNPCRRGGSSDGVGDWFNDDCSPHSWWDFGNRATGTWTHSLDPGIQRNRIYESASVQGGRGGGDVGFHKNVSAAANQTYTLSALVKLTNVSRNHEKAFRARLTIHAYEGKSIIRITNAKGNEVPFECNAFLFDAGTGFQRITTKQCVLPANTTMMKVNARAHSKTYKFVKNNLNVPYMPAGKTAQDVAGWGQTVFDELTLTRNS